MQNRVEPATLRMNKRRATSSTLRAQWMVSPQLLQWLQGKQASTELWDSKTLVRSLADSTTSGRKALDKLLAALSLGFVLFVFTCNVGLWSALPLKQVVMKIECCSDNNLKCIEAMMKAVTDVC